MRLQTQLLSGSLCPAASHVSSAHVQEHASTFKNIASKSNKVLRGVLVANDVYGLPLSIKYLANIWR